MLDARGLMKHFVHDDKMDFIHRTAEGQILSAQDKRGALAISPSIVRFIVY